MHTAWPLSQCARIKKRYSSAARGEDAVAKFRKRYFLSFGVSCGQHSNSTPPKSNCKTNWLVLPYKVCWARAKIGKSLAKVPLPYALERMIGAPRLAWKLGGSRLVHAL